MPLHSTASKPNERSHYWAGNNNVNQPQVGKEKKVIVHARLRESYTSRGGHPASD